ncbi:MAG: hypothetical protein H0X65_01510 [Gemmatimonadetes bacterium]|jgi:TolA-binding protein|nr:hypothetical protein [Gemmatimonadota bacterium]
MKRLSLVLLALALSSCAHLPGGTRGEDRTRTELWNEAHLALYAQDFARAGSVFTSLATRFPDTEEGREAVFYIGTLHLDPRNRGWDSDHAETAFRQYLGQDTLGTLIHRRPEATTLLEVAVQLNMPPEERVTGLQPGTRIIEGPTTRVVVPAGQQRELTEEIERLRRQVAERDDQIRRQREELERIRRTLTPRP